MDPQDGATQPVWLRLMIVSFNLGIQQSMFEGNHWPEHALGLERIFRKFYTAEGRNHLLL